MNQQDKRFARDPRDRTPRPEIGTETVPVNLVELQAVGRTRRPSPLPLFLIGMAVVAIIAFALGGSLATPPAASPGPSTVAAIATGTAAAGTPTPRPRSTMNLPTAAPTPTPAPTFPWTWVRSELRPGTSVAGIWGAGDRILLLEQLPRDNEDRYDWQVETLVAGGAWQSFSAPPAIAELFGGSVIDDRLWFIARVEGVTDADTSWQLVSTETGESWETHGATEGLGPVAAVSFLRQFRGVWMANVWGHEGSDARMLWSADGRIWHVARLPEFGGTFEFWDAGAIGDRMLLLGREFRSFEDVETFVLTSTDGKVWKRSPAPLPEGALARQLSCSVDVCVIPVDPLEQDGTRRVVLRTSNGLDWSGITLDLPMLAPASTIQSIRPAGRGFVAGGGQSGFAFLSADGRDWLAVQVMPADRLEYLDVLAVGGDLVVGHAPSQDSSVPDAIWQGSLSEMRKG
jgi:hypothetical protein